MKRFMLFPLFGMLLLSCQRSEPFTGEESGGSSAEPAAGLYLAVQFKTGNNSGTRADETYPPGTYDGYEDGQEHENNVSLVRFFFFDSNGNPARVGGGESAASWIDRVPASQGGSIPEETVEKIVEATLELRVERRSDLPAQVLAVLNPSDDVKRLTAPSMAEIRQVVADFKTGLMGKTDRYSDKDFVMSNTVYLSNDKRIMETIQIPSDRYYPTAAEAAKNPVVIYVERVLARLDFGFGSNLEAVRLPDGTTGYLTTEADSDDDAPNTQAAGDPIYARVLSWDVLDDPDQSRLLKSIHPEWPENHFGEDYNQRWNTADYRRCFWAINPPANRFGYRECSYNEIREKGLELPNHLGYTTIYLQENAAPLENLNGAPVRPTRIVVAAELVNSEGKPVSVAMWGGKRYTYEGLKNALASAVNADGKLYKRTETATKTTFTPFYPEDFELQEQEGKVYPRLTAAAETKTWSAGNQIESAPYADAAAVNAYLAGVAGNIQLWKEGKTTYQFAIRHLGAQDTPGYYGIVRNHIYRATVNRIHGFGTPVYDPDKPVEYPKEEEPELVTGALGISVKILQWRIVSQEYDLTWPAD